MKHVDLNSAFNHIKPERIVEISKKLIRVPSVTGNERNVVLLAQDIIRDLGIDTKLYGTDERPILTAAINSKSEKQLVFNGHLDTVPTASLDDWSNDPYDPQIIEGKMYGRGSSDMKASCAVMIHILEI